MDARVSALSVPSYDAGLFDRAVAEHFRLLEADSLFRPGMKVCLKPNLLMRAGPERAVTTHPALVEAVIRRLKALGVEDIVVADSPGGPYTKAALEGIYRASGLAAAVERAGGRLNLDTGSVPRSTAAASLCREFNLIKPAAEADAVINLPKLKTHGMVMLSAGVKNLLGCVPGLEKPELHFRFPDKGDFCRMLVDLSLLVKPTLTIVDAVDSMEGNGPSGGTVRRTAMTFAARNVYALDVAVCDFLGLAYDNAPTVRHAIEAGLCPPSGDAVQWLGERPAFLTDYALPDSRPHDFTSFLPGFLKKPGKAIMSRLFETKPAIRRETCVGCGKCAESCAPRAAVIRDGKAVIDYSKCIKCYCCHEMCPVQAVAIKRPFFLKG